MIEATKDVINKEYLDQFLDETEQAKISQFWMDEVMREAVRKVLLFGIYNEGTITKGKVHRSHVNFALVLPSLVEAGQLNMKDEDLGKEIRTCWKAIDMLRMVFDKFAMYKLEEAPKFKGNDAR